MSEHLGRLRKTYSQRATSLHEELLRQFSGRVRCEAPKGGMFLWAEFGESVSTSRLLKTALQKQVAFVPGTAFYTDQGGDSAMRLNFTNTDLNRIRLGITRLFDSFLSFSS
jgi:2-aminoadipate transaminase